MSPELYPPAPRQNALGVRLLWILLALVLGGVLFTYIGTRFLWRDLVPARRTVSDLPSYGTVADFELTDQLGRPIRKSDFDGQPWVADFIFTRCAGPCPLMTAQMARMADSLGAGSPVRFASFSIDPEHDTAEALKTYSDNYGADPSRWHFLTGERRKIADLARNSFHLAVDDPRPRVSTQEGGTPGEAAATVDSTAAYDIPHSLRFALVDARGEIRGYYDGTDGASLAHLYEDLELLVARGS
jgi:protein SCO1/2